ncbi:hypothetical protein OsJ_01569 [Oryza sativa Japonica Group]|uniref:Polygalacturonase n=1 Tax=Oryza sativa subsp. japonica TaxID=39947 RepID=B9EW65_ORYSJ|nr:hypothetical protein OsJ_01569 [Oryza sativa Japonica Group]
MGPTASAAARRSTRQPSTMTTTMSRRTAAAVAVSVVLLLLSSCLPCCSEARLHYHRRQHRRAPHRGHHRAAAAAAAATNGGSHISQPPAALPPDFDSGESPAETPGLPPAGVEDAPPRRSPREKPCPTMQPPVKPPEELSPVGAPRSRVRAMPPSPSLSPPAKRRHILTLRRRRCRRRSGRRFLPPRRRRRSRRPRHLNSPQRTHIRRTITRSHRHCLRPSHQCPRRRRSIHRGTPRQSHRRTLRPSHRQHYVRRSLGPQCQSHRQSLRCSHRSGRLPGQQSHRRRFHRSSPRRVPPPAHAPAETPAPPTTPPALPPATTAPSPKNSSSSPPPPCTGGGGGISNVFDVRAFGATGNGSSADGDTRAFRAAWKAACSAESATVLVPSDGVFTITSTIFAGPCKPGLTFQIDGVLMPPDGPASWPAADGRRQWIVFYRADGMTLSGKGTIEGNGEEWWNLPCKPHRGPNGSTLPGPCESPALIKFVASSDVSVQGLRMENSPQFHLKFDGCSRVLVDGLVVSSPASSPNTDGVHVENTSSVRILNSRISNGDDCVSIGGGCSGVRVENVTCVHGHGISIGGLGARGARACVSNVTRARRARRRTPTTGVRIKTWQGGAGSVSGVVFDAVQMVNVRGCIVIDPYYCDAHGGAGAGCANQTAAVRVDGVAYRGIRGTYNPRGGGGAPVRFACSDTVACTGITMTDVELLPAGGGDEGGGASAGAKLADPYCWNAYGVMETLTQPPVHCLQEGRPESLQDQLASC